MRHSALFCLHKLQVVADVRVQRAVESSKAIFAPSGSARMDLQQLLSDWPLASASCTKESGGIQTAE
jgi:hypothetical protein